MELVTEPRGTIDLAVVPLHLGRGARTLALEGFAWDPDVLDAYDDQTAADGADGRLMAIFDSSGAWDSWERHPAGDEVVICLSGRMTIIQERDGGEQRVDLGPLEAMVNPAGVWHTADVDEPGRFLTITPGRGTEHRSR